MHSHLKPQFDISHTVLKSFLFSSFHLFYCVSIEKQIKAKRNYIFHNGLIRNLIELNGAAKLTAQGERVCLKDSKYILFEILANRTWKGCDSSGQPSQLKCQLGLLGRQELVQPFHVLFARISNKVYLESLRHTCSHCTCTFNVSFSFIFFLIGLLCRRGGGYG